MPSFLRRLQVAPWAVAAAGFAMMFASGAIWGSFTLFLVAIEADTGWSKTTIALGFTVFTFFGACTAPVTGWLTDRHGAQATLAGLTLVFALGLGLAALADSPLAFYASFGMLGGFGAQCCGSYTLFTVAGNWFRRPATAMAIMDSGSGIGTLVSLPVLRLIIEAHSWRAAYLALAILALVVVLPLAAVFMRLHPPGREPPPPADGHVAHRSPLAAVGAISASPVLRWLAIVHLLAPMTFHAIGSHQVAYFQDAGMRQDVAVLLVATTGFTFFAGRLAFGALIDARGIATAGAIKAVAAIATLTLMLALPLLASAAPSYAYPVLFAIGFSSTGILFTNAARLLIDPASFNAVFGAMRLLYGTGVALGPPAMAAMVDATGRFDLPLALVGVVLLFHHAAFVALARGAGRRGAK
jgi:predicted MFS family arabinose efflux permease